MLQSKLFLWLMGLLSVVVLSAGTAVVLHANNASSNTNSTQQITGSGSSNGNNKPSTTTTSTSTTTTIPSVTTTTVKTNSGNGNPVGTGNAADNKSFTIAGGVPDLYPGAAKQLPLTVSNPNAFAIKVTSITVTTSAASNAGCTTSSVSADPFSGGLVVPKNGTATTSVAVRMTTSAPNACQGATFTLLYSGIAEKA